MVLFWSVTLFSVFFFNDPATTEIYTLSLHDALPISPTRNTATIPSVRCSRLLTVTGSASVMTERRIWVTPLPIDRSEEHTSELQSRRDLVCRLLLEKKNKT